MQQDTNQTSKQSQAEQAQSVANAIRNLDTMERHISMMIHRMRDDLTRLFDQINNS